MQAMVKQQAVVAPEESMQMGGVRDHLMWQDRGVIHRPVPKDMVSRVEQTDELDNGDPPDLMLWGEE